MAVELTSDAAIIALSLLLLVQSYVAFLSLALARRSRRRLRALRSTCYLTDHDGVRRRYHRVSVHKQREAER